MEPVYNGIAVLEILSVKAYDIWVKGIQITENNKADVLGDGTVSYDPETNTLTLDNAKINYECQLGEVGTSAGIAAGKNAGEELWFHSSKAPV